MPAISFPSPPSLRYPGGCSLEPAIYALDFLVHWRADVEVGPQRHADVGVLELLRNVQRDPAAFGVSAHEAAAARERFLNLAGQLLEQEGGQRAWLEREFGR